MSENSIGKLTAALATVSKAVGSLAPDKRNREQNYEYISADKILSTIGQAMATNGVMVVPSVTSDDYQAVTYQSRGQEKNRIDARATFMMTVAHESGEYLNMPWIGYGTDYVTPDKALYKAITSGHKYFLMKLFNVGIGNEDAEHEPPADNEGVVYRQPPARKAEPVQRQPVKPNGGSRKPSPKAAAPQQQTATLTGDPITHNLASFAKWYVNEHSFYTDNTQVVKVILARWPDAGTKFTTRDPQDYIDELEAHAKAEVDAQ